MNSLPDLLPIAVAAVRRGNNMMLRRTPGQLTAKGDRDYATEVDFAIEREVRRFLLAATPHVGFLGEEEGGQRSVAGEVWTLDPVDGTVNWVHGIPLCGVSLALVRDGQPILGVIALPYLNDWYTACYGGGAFRNGVPIRASSARRLGDAVVALGDYAVGTGARDRNVPRLAVTTALAARVLRLRMVGSAAVDLVWVAEGRVDASVALSNKPWDMAAGVVVAREAGAVVCDVDGSEHTAESTATVASAPGLADELVETVRRAQGGVVATP